MNYDNIDSSDLSLIREKSAAWGVEFDDRKIIMLNRYISLLIQYNSRLNLISAGDEDHIFQKHILDSMEVIPLLDVESSPTILDAGSGGGLPGIPIAIALPGLKITLLERSSKKFEFLTMVQRKLEPENIIILNDSLENLSNDPAVSYDIILFRAVNSFDSCVSMAAGFISRGSRLIHFSRRSGNIHERFRLYP